MQLRKEAEELANGCSGLQGEVQKLVAEKEGKRARLQQLEDQVRFVVYFDLYVCFFFHSGCAYIKTVLLIICGHGLG